MTIKEVADKKSAPTYRDFDYFITKTVEHPTLSDAQKVSVLKVIRSKCVLAETGVAVAVDVIISDLINKLQGGAL